MRRRLQLALCSLPLLAALALAVTCDRRPDPGKPRTPADLAARLRSLGLDYEGRFVGPARLGEPFRNQGYYLRRFGDRRPWEELASNPARAPATMRGFVLVLSLRQPYHATEEAGEPESGRWAWGPFVLVGDPAEVKRIADALRNGS
jgi:hypothetical protein